PEEFGPRPAGRAVESTRPGQRGSMMGRAACPACGSDLVTTAEAGGSACPSCGAAPTPTPTQPEVDRTATYERPAGPGDPRLAYTVVKADGGIDLSFGLGGPPEDRLDAFAPGMELQGRYRLVSELGRGGFGLVFLGHDKRLDRPVAVKVMLPTRR